MEPHLDDSVSIENSLCAKGFESFLCSWLARISIFLKVGDLLAYFV